MLLRRFISFQLEVLAARWTAAASEVVAETGGLRLREWRVLAVLAEKSPLAPAVVGVQAALDKAGVSRAVDTLQSRGLIDADTDPDDARRLQLRPTPEGKALARKISTALRKREDEMLSGLRPSDQWILTQIAETSVATASKEAGLAEKAA